MSTGPPTCIHKLTVQRRIKCLQAFIHPCSTATMHPLLLAFASILASLGGVAAHGYVQDVVVGSTHYTGYLPYTDPYYSPPPERIIRKIPGNGTVFSLT